MRKLVFWLENHVLPLANRLAQIRFMFALKNAFVSVMPITIAGSLAVLIKSLIAVAQKNVIWRAFAFAIQPLATISDIVWRGSFSLFALFLTISLGYQLAKTFETNRLAGSIISLASFMMSVANFAQLRIHGENITIKNAFDISQFSTSGIFTAILFSSIGFAIYAFCYKTRIMLQLNANLPHAEQAAFESLLPGIIALFGVGGINYIFQAITGTYFGNWLLYSMQVPLVNMGQGFGMVMLVTLLIQLFWFFGFNGVSVLAPIFDSIWLTAQNINITVANHGQIPHFIWVSGSFNAFSWFGGTGGTLALIIAILLFSKRTDYRTVAKVALAPGIFNISEPVVFGLPIVLNPIYFIPFVLAPLFNVAFSYWVTVMGLVNPVQVAIPSIIPPIISSYLACNYDWRAVVLSIFNILFAVAIWTPFVFAADKIADSNEQRKFFTQVY